MDINIILCHWNKIGYVQIFRLIDLSDISMILRSLEFVLDRIVCILCLSGPLMLSDNVQYDCLPSLIKRWSFGAILQIVIQNPGEVHCWKNLKIWLDSYWERRVKNYFPFKHPLLSFYLPEAEHTERILFSSWINHKGIIYLHTVINPEPLHGET